MNLEELITNIQKLQEDFDKISDFCNNLQKYDPIFLLNRKEYEKYKTLIPYWRVQWWLRSSGGHTNYVSFVNYDGSINECGDHVYSPYIAVRPVIKSEKIIDANLGERISLCGFPFIKIDSDLAIAEVPISFGVFDDEQRNDYASSKVRAFLIDWYNERKDF